MSTEAVTKFLSRMAADSALQEQATSLAKNAQNPAAAAVDLGAKHGFQFTESEFLEVIRFAQKARSGELGDTELERVAGGLLLSLDYRLWDAGALFFSAKSIGGVKYTDYKYSKI